MAGHEVPPRVTSTSSSHESQVPCVSGQTAAPTSWPLTTEVTEIDLASLEPPQKLNIEPEGDGDRGTVCPWLQGEQ